MTISNGGTRVRFVDDERLDIIDAERMQTFGEQWAAQNLGILGLCSGVVGDPPTFTYSTITTRLTIGPCVLAYSEVDPATGALSTATVVYDPTNPAQPTMAPIVGPFAGSTAVLWAQRSEVAAQSETRRKWDTGTGTEVAFATETVYVGVTSAQAAPVGVVPAGTGWFPFAKITAWSGAPTTPTVVPLSIWDGEFQGTNLGNASVMTPFPYLPTANVVGGTTLSRGLANLLMKVRASLAKLIDSSDGTAWWDTTGLTRGMTQVDAILDPVENSPITVASCVYRWTGAGYSAIVGKNIVLPTLNPGVGVIDVKMSLPTGWNKAGVQATVVGDTGSAAYPTYRIVTPQQPDDWTSLGGDDWQIRVYQYDVDSLALADGPFSISVQAFAP